MSNEGQDETTLSDMQDALRAAADDLLDTVLEDVPERFYLKDVELKRQIGRGVLVRAKLAERDDRNKEIAYSEVEALLRRGVHGHE